MDLKEMDANVRGLSDQIEVRDYWRDLVIVLLKFRVLYAMYFPELFCIASGLKT